MEHEWNLFHQIKWGCGNLGSKKSSEGITLHSGIKSIAISITLPDGTLTICNIYLPNQMIYYYQN
ncbi:Reverse transcriptase domain-containing protein [Aphis craccivora]|uniref:Reverse transcriptase domain-containing protein n=1 Tax=Aphis craccivora TaxID=307492 RepID=A0A6G0Y8T5_APHCR|nr:Reverse transcriptase domain-containing protein [Aphis craccivora]